MLALALLLSTTSAQRPFGESVLDAIVAPGDGAVDVPTNAHLFFPLRLPIDATLTVSSSSSSSTIPLVLDAIPAAGVPLGELPANADVTLVLDDGVDVRPIHWRTGAGPDVTPPGAPANVQALVVTSDDHPPEIVLHCDAAADDVGVAVYDAIEVDGAGAPKDRGLRFEGAAPSSGAIEIGAFVDGPRDLSFVVVARDRAGNAGPASAVASAHVNAAPGGCASTDASSSWIVLALMLVGGRAAAARRAR